MTIEKVEKNNVKCAVISSKKMIIRDVQSALYVLMKILYDDGIKNIVIDKNLFAEDFFILSTGLAEEVLQKFFDYGVWIAIYGDFSHYTSKSLNYFIYESNKGRDLFFVTTKEEAIERVTR